MVGGALGSAEEMWTEPREKGCITEHIIVEYRDFGTGFSAEPRKKPGYGMSLWTRQSALHAVVCM